MVADSFTPFVCLLHVNSLELRLEGLDFFVNLLEQWFDGLNLLGPLNAVNLTLHDFSFFYDVKNREVIEKGWLTTGSETIGRCCGTSNLNVYGILLLSRQRHIFLHVFLLDDEVVGEVVVSFFVQHLKQLLLLLVEPAQFGEVLRLHELQILLAQHPGTQDYAILVSKVFLLFNLLFRFHKLL
jgi:hypothetical protein